MDITNLIQLSIASTYLMFFNITLFVLGCFFLRTVTTKTSHKAWLVITICGAVLGVGLFITQYVSKLSLWNNAVESGYTFCDDQGNVMIPGSFNPGDYVPDYDTADKKVTLRPKYI